MEEKTEIYNNERTVLYKPSLSKGKSEARSKRFEERVEIVPGKNAKGNPVFAVLVKRSYTIQHNKPLQRMEQAAPFLETDVYYDKGDPEWATVQYESDKWPYKPATDVVVIAKAYAPGGKPTQRCDVSVRVGNKEKVLTVTGNRQCNYQPNKLPLFTQPQSFTEMEMRYENAYGGTDKISNPKEAFYYPRNPLGKGVAVLNVKDQIDELPLPNIEDSNDMLTPERVVIEELTHWNRQPLPQGFGWYQKTWYPRSSFCGAFPAYVNPDEVMREENLGIVPQHQSALAKQFKLPSFDPKFTNGASLGMVFDYLTGKEALKLKNLSKHGEVTFFLPDDKPRMALDVGEGQQQLSVSLQTVCVRMEDNQVDMIWQGHWQYPGLDWLPNMKKLVAEVY